MKLLRLKLTSFKNFDLQEFQFGNTNLLIGKNGAGKSAIKDAILFLLFNRTSDGSLADSSKLIAHGAPKCIVEGEFEDGMIIRRERSEKGTKITYLDNSQALEDSNITQRELESMIPQFHIFNAVFNVGSFMLLDDKEKRKMVMELVPDVDRMLIYGELGGLIEWIERYKLNVNDAPLTYKMLLANRRKFTDDITTYLGQISMLAEPIVIPEVTRTDVSAEIETLRQDIASYNKFETEKAVYVRDKRLAESQDVINEEVTKEIEILNESLTGAKPYESDSIEKISSRISVLTDKISDYESIPEEAVCFTCNQNIPDEYRHLVAQEIERAREELVRLSFEYKEEKKKIEDAEQLVFNDEKNKNTLNIAKSRLKKVVHPIEPTVVKKPDIDRWNTLHEKQAKFLAEEQYIKKLNEDETQRQERFQDISDKIEKARKIVSDLELLIPIFAPTGLASSEMRQKIVPINYILKKWVPDATIETLELLKNGLETKEVFKLMLGDKEYKKLSTGEKLKLDIAISEMLDEMSRYKVKMKFVDNGECIDHDPKINPQSFIAKVTGDPLLKIIN